MIFCIAVRLNRKAKNAIGAAGAPQEMFWIEPRNPAQFEDTGVSIQNFPTSSRKESKNGRVLWYRLPGKTYVSN